MAATTTVRKSYLTPGWGWERSVRDEDGHKVYIIRRFGRTFRIAPDTNDDSYWRLDYLDLFIWVALTPTLYSSAKDAAEALLVCASSLLG